MHGRQINLFLIMGLSYLLISCNTMQADHSKRVCKALKDNIRFQSSTFIHRMESTQAGMPRTEHNYDQQGCVS